MPTTLKKVSEEPAKKLRPEPADWKNPSLTNCSITINAPNSEFPFAGSQGAGETPAKAKPKLKPKTRKSPADKIPKPIPAPVVVDSTPKKYAQRAKGSISLNKAPDPPEPDLRRNVVGASEKLARVEGISQRSPPAHTLSHVPTPVHAPSYAPAPAHPPTHTLTLTHVAAHPPAQASATASSPAPAPAPSPNPSPPPFVSSIPTAVPAVKAKRKKRILDKPKLEIKESFLRDMEDENQDLIKEQTLEVVEPPVEPPPVEEIANRPVSHSFNTCSFFERLQQGVKAYFTSRNSFPDDRNKKDGGIGLG